MSAHGNPRPRLAVLLSGGGRSLQNLIDRIADGRLGATVAGVASDRADAFGLQRAREHDIDARHLTTPSTVWDWIGEMDCDLVILAGYLKLLPIAPEFEGRVLNIHPSLLPEFGGKGMFGDHVHRAVLDAGRAESGCTVHICDNIYDNGRVLIQARVPVLADDDPASLGARVFRAECEAFPAAIQLRWRELQSAPTDR